MLFEAFLMLFVVNLYSRIVLVKFTMEKVYNDERNYFVTKFTLVIFSAEEWSSKTLHERLSLLV